MLVSLAPLLTAVTKCLTKKATWEGREGGLFGLTVWIFCSLWYWCHGDAHSQEAERDVLLFAGPLLFVESKAPDLR